METTEPSRGNNGAKTASWAKDSNAGVSRDSRERTPLPQLPARLRHLFTTFRSPASGCGSRGLGGRSEIALR
ncbi:hypothetical protein Pmani_025159 [Petrolisthes manimaculis]|uniref:Uncharacterized protein n=1 Tax=Petrolisthes manimaculis TaxID=1843537 RepID=A0AAE1P7T9_9EUCA|nr:hypothetical protein Pmani_025159 [Petrolisthes manimaculis]